MKAFPNTLRFKTGVLSVRASVQSPLSNVYLYMLVLVYVCPAPLSSHAQINLLIDLVFVSQICETSCQEKLPSHILTCEAKRTSEALRKQQENLISISSVLSIFRLSRERKIAWRRKKCGKDASFLADESSLLRQLAKAAATAVATAAAAFLRLSHTRARSHALTHARRDRERERENRGNERSPLGRVG